MQASMILLVLFSSTLIANTDAGSWFRRTVTNVGRWVGEHCRRGQNGFGCTFSIGKRSVLDSSTDCDTLKATVTRDDLPTEVLVALFDASDKNNDGELSDEEKVDFKAQLDETEKCLNSA
ncbi:uncharacterized protein [Littorina saxatilis]|uniref:EF-hand domain-containing protein n=1 Tax=Littorina saxatilis TaxID=31220 RepID=A0AAN9AZQ6_9CAEN